MGWEPGDRAYCEDSRTPPSAKPVLVAGRVYCVEEVILASGGAVGLNFLGLSAAPYKAFNARRFHRIPAGETFHTSRHQRAEA